MDDHTWSDEEARPRPGSVSRSVWAKAKAIDAVLKTRLNQGVDRDRVVCESLQDCFDLLAKETLEKTEDLEDSVRRWEIQNGLLEIAVALEWLAPPMAPSNIAWGHREWLMRLLEGRIAYFESCLLGETSGAIDKLGYVVLKVPETNPLFQSEEALEELKKQFSQPRKVFDIEILKLHASSAYGTPPEKVTPEQLGATIDAFMRKYGSIRVTGIPATLLGKGDGAPQPNDSKPEQAELPIAKRPPAGCISRPLGSSDRLLAKMAAPFSKVNDPRSASAQANQDAVEEMQAQPMDLPNMTNSPAHEPRRTESGSEMASSDMIHPQGVKSATKRGRRPDKERRDAIRNEISKHGEQWRDHLSEIFTELDNQGVRLGDFQNIKIDLGDGQSSSVSSWGDLDLAQGEQLRQIVDSLRKYADRRI